MTATSTVQTTSRRRLLIGACALACAIAAPQADAWGWGGDTVTGSGPVTRQERALGHFSGLSVSLPGDVQVRTGNSESVSIETEGNLLPLVETVIEDGTLKIRAKRDTNLRTRHLKIVVQTRGIERVSLAGSADVDVDAMRGARVRFDIGGSGEIKLRRLEAEDVSVNLGGSGELDIDGGTARALHLSVAGSGDIDMAHVRADSASVSLAGSGGAKLWVRNSLNLSVAGSGDVEYYGDPKVSTSVMGSGSARRIGAAPN